MSNRSFHSYHRFHPLTRSNFYPCFVETCRKNSSRSSNVGSEGCWLTLTAGPFNNFEASFDPSQSCHNLWITQLDVGQESFVDFRTDTTVHAKHSCNVPTQLLGAWISLHWIAHYQSHQNISQIIALTLAIAHLVVYLFSFHDLLVYLYSFDLVCFVFGFVPAKMVQIWKINFYKYCDIWTPYYHCNHRHLVRVLFWRLNKNKQQCEALKMTKLNVSHPKLRTILPCVGFYRARIYYRSNRREREAQNFETPKRKSVKMFPSPFWSYFSCSKL